MKKTLLFLFCLFSATIVLAQRPTNFKTITLTGKVIDAKTNQPLEYATIILKNTKTKKITGGITDAKGLFSIKTNKG